MNKRTKILIGILIFGILVAGDWWLWSLESQKRISNEFCTDDILENCDGKKIILIGEIKSVKGGLSLCNIESLDVNFNWGGVNCVLLVNLDYRYYIDKKVRINGLVQKGGKTCEPFSQCWDDGTPTTIKVESIEIIPYEVTVTTDKTEYEQGEIVKITVENDLMNPIKYYENVACDSEVFIDGRWVRVYSIVNTPCIWGDISGLGSGDKSFFNWTPVSGAGRYRIAFHYKEQRLIKTKELDNIVCDNMSSELENLLAYGKWSKNKVEPCVMCAACLVCGCTMENVWSVDGASIDVSEVSCVGSIYKIKYGGETFICFSEKYKENLLSPSPHNWSAAYSNEFTIS